MGQRDSEKEQRRHPRTPFSFKLTYTSGTETFTENILNLSQGGTFIKTHNPLTKDSVINLEFEIPNIDYHFKMDGRVAWIKDRENKSEFFGMGIEFLDMKEEDTKHLLQFIVHSQLTQKGY